MAASSEEGGRDRCRGLLLGQQEEGRARHLLLLPVPGAMACLFVGTVVSGRFE